MKNVYLVVLFTFLACSLHAQVESSHAEKVEVSAGIGYGWLLNSNLSPYGLHYRGNYDTGIGQKLLVPYRGHEQRACTLRDTLAFIQRNGMDVEQISQTKEQCIISRDNCEDAYILKDYRAFKLSVKWSSNKDGLRLMAAV